MRGPTEDDDPVYQYGGGFIVCSKVLCSMAARDVGDSVAAGIGVARAASGESCGVPGIEPLAIEPAGAEGIPLFAVLDG